MFTTNFNELMQFLATINSIEDSFVIAKDAYPIEKFHLQPITREIDGMAIQCMALKNIVVAKEAQRQGLFKQIIAILEQKQFPFMVDDIVNNNVDRYLSKKGYHRFEYRKNNDKLLARYTNI